MLAGMRTCLAVLLLSLALVATACGKHQKPQTAAEWANAFCSGALTWKSSLTDAKNTFTASPSKDSLTKAVNDVKDATNTFVSDTKSLGKPPTSDGAQAQQLVSELSTSVNQTTQTIETAIKSVNSVNDALNAASIISTNLSKLKDDASTTVNKLTDLNPGGELQTAIKQSSQCQSLGVG
jgi:hypothetical protein